ncbi:MAG: hypothetical protein IJY25_03940 [Bacilli bacterium]|nr:hypothetical protein [Bacilli bacterium]MBQ9072285.1 hypothetical protein [Bacilli bacterium]
MKKIVRSTLRLDERLDFKIKFIAKQNNVSENKMKEYLLEIGLQTYFEKYDDYFKRENKKIRKEDKNDSKD